MPTDLQEPIVETPPVTIPGDSTAMAGYAANGRGCFDPPIVRRADRRFVRQTEPGDAGEKPGRKSRQSGAVLTTALMFRPAAVAGRTSASNSRSRPGYGSPCSSAVLAEAMAKGRVKPVPTACAKPKPAPRRRRSPQRQNRSRPGCHYAKATSCEPNDVIPGDGDVIEGIASVDESVITGESAPVIRELWR